MSDVDQLLSLIGTHNKLLRDVIEYVERTEAERDEARASYRNLLESVKQISGCYP